MAGAMAESLKRQFAEAFGVLSGAIPKFTEEQWRSGRSPYDGPARATLHALQAAEFYTCQDSSIFGAGRFGPPVWEMTDADLPTQEQMVGYLHENRAKTDRWIERLDEQGLDQPTDEKGTLALERITYAIRHLQHHTGEVCCWQKQFDHDQNQWV
ncbi:MAG: hypothetical protein ACLFVU_07900 [Phycisphaerae bacterium]